MITTVLADFKDRSKQVEKYLLWLSNQESKGGLPDGVLNTAKASALLLIYNLMESTSSSAIQCIFDSMVTTGVHYDQLSKSLKIITIKNVKSKAAGKIVEDLLSISTDIYKVSFDKDNIFSGNVDALELRNTMKNFGISQNFDYKEPELQNIKNSRNDLAHGNLSFAEAGKDLTAKEIIGKYWRVRVFFNHMLADYGRFIAEQRYLSVA